jgi:hypothetical protein
VAWAPGASKVFNRPWSSTNPCAEVIEPVTPVITPRLLIAVAEFPAMVWKRPRSHS